MNILEFIKQKDIDLLEFSKAINAAPNSIKTTTGKKDMKRLTVEQLINIHETFGLTYNDIVGENVFSVDNIGVTENKSETKNQLQTFSDDEIAILKLLIKREKDNFSLQQ